MIENLIPIIAQDVTVPLWFSELGWVGVVVLAVVLIFTGKLRTEREIREHQKAVEMWQSAYDNERRARHENLGAVNETLKVAELILNIVMAWDDLLKDDILSGERVEEILRRNRHNMKKAHQDIIDEVDDLPSRESDLNDDDRKRYGPR